MAQFTRSTSVNNAVSQLPNKPTISATALKATFDKYGTDDKPYINNTLLPELESATDGSSGADKIGATPITGGTANTIQGVVEELRSFQTTLDGQNVKITGNQTINGIKTFVSSPVVPTPSTANQASSKGYVDTVATDFMLGVIPDNSLTNAKLGTDIKVGSLTALDALLTGFTSSITTAINKVVSWIGDLTTLTTNNKSNLVNAINEANDKGFNADLEQYYSDNVIQFCDGSEEITTTVGTVTIDYENVLVGNSSVRATENDNTASGVQAIVTLKKTYDVTKFQNGSAFSDADFIVFPFKHSDVSKIDVGANKGVEIIFATSTSNWYRYSVVTGLLNGDNVAIIPKSAFRSEGSPNWNNITKIYCQWWSLANAQNVYASFHTRGIVGIRKDPTGNFPNPYQSKVDGSYVADLSKYLTNSFNWIIVKLDNLLKIVPLQLSSNPYLVMPQYNDKYTVTSLFDANDNYGGTLIREFAGSFNASVFPASDGNLYLNINGVNKTTPIEISKGDRCILEFTRNSKTYIAKLTNISKLKKYTLDGESLSYHANPIITVASGETGLKQNILGLSITTIENCNTANHALIADNVVNLWQNYIPTLTFTGTPPSSITTVARYTTIGNVCHFNVSCSSADGNGATNLTISLPVTPKNNLSTNLVLAHEKVNTTWSALLGYISQSGSVVSFRTFNTATDAQAWEIIITGSYEI